MARLTWGDFCAAMAAWGVQPDDVIDGIRLEGRQAPRIVIRRTTRGLQVMTVGQVRFVGGGLRLDASWAVLPVPRETGP